MLTEVKQSKESQNPKIAPWGSDIEAQAACDWFDASQYR
jgi:hypothetical protein